VKLPTMLVSKTPSTRSDKSSRDAVVRSALRDTAARSAYGRPG